MSRFEPLLWRKPPVIWSYGIAVLSVVTALVISKWPPLHLEAAPVSLFLCAVIFSAWFGGTGPGLWAAVLSTLAFYYYFLAPTYSLVVKPEEIARLVVFMVSVLFVGSLTAAQRGATESLRRARDELKGTVQDLERTNEALQTESRERKRAEEALRRSENYLAEAQRLTHTGSWVWQVAGDETPCTCPRNGIAYMASIRKRVCRLGKNGCSAFTHEDRAKWQEAIDRAITEKSDYEVEFRILLPDGTVKYIHTVGHPVLNAAGDLVRIRGKLDGHHRQ